MKNKPTGTATASAWRAASRAEREARAQPLRLPSGTTILAVKPDPLEWIISGRIPQALLGAALKNDGPTPAPAEGEITREEILDLARFATRLVEASVVEPALGDGPGEIALEDIPCEDRAFIFEWACRALSQTDGGSDPAATRRGRNAAPARISKSSQEDLSSDKLERFCPE